MAFNQTTKQVNASITKVNATKLRGDIQTAVLGVIGHAMEHGSSPLAETLMDRMTLAPMLKKLAPMVSAYLIKFGPFVYGKDTGWQFSKSKKAALVEAGYDYDDFIAEAAVWDDVAKEEKKAESFDLFKEFEKLIAKSEKKNVAGECITSDLIPYLKALKAKFVSDCALKAAQQSSKAEEPAKVEGETVPA